MDPFKQKEINRSVNRHKNAGLLIRMGKIAVTHSHLVTFCRSYTLSVGEKINKN
jgi:hypothetical protein